MKTIKFVVLFSLVALIPCRAEEITPTENTKGCVLKDYSTVGDCRFILFMKVADAEYESANGEPQIWGYDPQDIHKDRKGNPFYVLALSNKFVKSGWIRGRCHCPAW